MKRVKYMISLILAACLLSQYGLIWAVDSLNTSSTSFQQFELTRKQDGSLLKDVCRFGNTYLYQQKIGENSIAFQITPKNFYSVTYFANGKKYHAEGYADGLYATYGSPSQLELFKNLALSAFTNMNSTSNKDSIPSFSISSQAVSPQLYSTDVDSAVIKKSNEIWGPEGSAYIGGTSRTVNNVTYNCALYRYNNRDYGTEYRISISAGSLWDTIEFFADVPFSVVKTAVTFVLDGPSQAWKTVKDFIAKKREVENISTKVVYVNGQDTYSYYSGWDSSILFICGDIGWTPNANFEYTIKDADFDNHNNLYDKAVQNYIDFG